MANANDHLRRTFLAGIFAAVPVAATIFIIWYIETRTREAIYPLVGRNIPFIGMVLAVLLIYLIGLLVTSLIGKYLINVIDRILSRLPGLRDIYRVWKQIALTPAGSMGMWAKVVLVRDETGSMRFLGFTNGEPVPGDTKTWCVFVPNYPNPIAGRLYFVPSDQCLPLDMSVDEAFKAIISGGNYLPKDIGQSISASRPTAVAAPEL